MSLLSLTPEKPGTFADTVRQRATAPTPEGDVLKKDSEVAP